MSDYISHLASDESRYFTACGEPWQGWQQPEDAESYGAPPPRNPMNQPRPHKDKIYQCQACFRLYRKSEGTK